MKETPVRLARQQLIDAIADYACGDVFPSVDQAERKWRLVIRAITAYARAAIAEGKP